jgi:hypothetical protein
MNTTIKEMRRDAKQMNTAQLSSAQLSRKRNEYKNKGNDKQMIRKSAEMRRDIEQINNT